MAQSVSRGPGGVADLRRGAGRHRLSHLADGDGAIRLSGTAGALGAPGSGLALGTYSFTPPTALAAAEGRRA
jgi:hypothetical protein